MKRIILCISICVFSTTIFAQSSAARAKAILDEVSAKTKSYSTITVGFTFAHQTKDEGSEVSRTNGTLVLKKDKYTLELFGNKLYYNGTTLWTHMIDENEVIVSNVNVDDEYSFNPAKMLTMYETGFKYQFIQDRFEAGRALYIIDLYPEDLANSEYARVRLFVDKDKMQLYKLEYFAKDENIYTITVTSFVTNTSIADTAFSFQSSKFPGIMIIDER